MRLEVVLRGLADPVRLGIVNLLSAGELCVCDIEAMLAVPQPTVSRHLAYLRRCGLVGARRRGRFVYYRLVPGAGPAGTVMRAVRAALAGDRSLAARRRTAQRRVRDRLREPC